VNIHTRSLGLLIGATTVLALASCGSAGSATSTASTSAARPTSASPSTASPSPSLSQTSAPPSSEPATPVSAPGVPTPADSGESSVLTIANSKELAALMKVGDACDESVAAFADAHAGESIEFDASIAAMANHEDYKTRWDILIAPGNKGADSSRGPAFQYTNINVFDLNLTGSNVPDTVGVGDLLHVIADVGEYDATSCLFHLSPVSTTVR
jgi:hypothetical protein